MEVHRTDTANTVRHGLLASLQQHGIQRVYVARQGQIPPEKAYLSQGCDRLAVVLEGVHQMKLDTGGEIQAIKTRPGQAVWMPKGTWNRPTWALPVSSLTLQIYNDAIQFHLVHHSSGNARPDQVNVLRIERALPAQIRHTLDALRTPDVAEDVTPHLVRAICLMAAHYIDDPMPGSGPSRGGHQTWKSIYAYLEEHCTTDINRDELARRFGITPNHISRLFQQHSQESFTEVLTRLRLSYACELLKAEHLRVKEVASHSGFSDCNYFCRLFRKKIGCSPGEYRGTT